MRWMFRPKPSCAIGDWLNPGFCTNWSRETVMSSKQMKPERWRRIETLYHATLLREMDRDDEAARMETRALDQLRVALIEFTLLDAIDELLDLGRIGSGDVIVIFHG